MSDHWQIFKLGQFIWNFKKFIAQHKLSKQFCANTLCWSLSILYGTYQVTFPAYQDRALELPPKAPNFGLETLDFSHRLKDRVNWVTQLKKGLHAITARRRPICSTCFHFLLENNPPFRNNFFFQQKRLFRTQSPSTELLNSQKTKQKNPTTFGF